MNPIIDRLAELRAERKRVLAVARAITDKLVLTPMDRKKFEECLELLEEIKDLSARLTRAGEKWRIYGGA